jgi:hypothetical protein
METFFGRDTFEDGVVVGSRMMAAEPPSVRFSCTGEGDEEGEGDVSVVAVGVVGVVVIMERVAFEDTGCACSMPNVRTIA